MIGKYNNLKIKKMVDFGAYLEYDNNKLVLLPKKQIPKDKKIDDFIEVFLYNDSKGRLIATTNKPFITVGEIATLTVKDTNEIGAFLNIGLERDLFLPFKEQLKKVNKGDKIEVLMYVDKSNRLCATMYTNNKTFTNKIKNKNIRTLEYEQNSQLVYKIIKNKFKGHLIYTDKSCTSEQIKKDFNMSKNVFKKSIGKLLKDNKIKITEKDIYLYY